MTTIAIIQARMSSSRLPGKVLLPLAGKPAIWHIYQRAMQCREVSKVYVATSTDSTDDPLAEFCHREGFNLHRGSLDNVLQRFLDIRQQHPESDYLVRITGDCPLIEPPFIDCQIQAVRQFDGDICWSPLGSSALEGANAISWRALEKIHSVSSSEEDREHVGSPYMAAHPEQFRIVETGLPEELTSCPFRLTVDEEPDYKVMDALYTALWDKRQNTSISLRESIAWLREHPEKAVNQAVHHSAINVKVHGQIARWHNQKRVGRKDFSYD